MIMCIITIAWMIFMFEYGFVFYQTLDTMDKPYSIYVYFSHMCGIYVGLDPCCMVLCVFQFSYVELIEFHTRYIDRKKHTKKNIK